MEDRKKLTWFSRCIKFVYLLVRRAGMENSEWNQQERNGEWRDVNLQKPDIITVITLGHTLDVCN